MRRKFMVVPWEWEHRVCTCSQPGAHIPHPDNPHYMACSVCLKYVRYVMVMCSAPGCRLRFPKVFEHPMYCSCTPLCWDHCDEREEECKRERCRNIKAKSRKPALLAPLEVDYYPRSAPKVDDLTSPEIDFDMTF